MPKALDKCATAFIGSAEQHTRATAAAFDNFAALHPPAGPATLLEAKNEAGHVEEEDLELQVEREVQKESRR